MSEKDLTNSVMNKVVGLEKARTRAWLAKFWLVVLVLAGFLGIFAWMAWQEIVSRGILDLLQLFGEDREIIAAYWQDTFWVFWEELPQGSLFLIILMVILLAAFLLLFRGSFKIALRKFRLTQKYHLDK